MLVGFFSHHIRTPLNTAYMCLQILEKELRKVQPELRQSLQIIVDDIKKSSKEADAILNDLIKYEKIESNQMKMDMAKLAVMPFLKRHFVRLTTKANLENVSFNVKYSIEECEDPSQPHTDIYIATVYADKEYFKNVLSTVIGHALQSAGTGGEVNVRVFHSDSKDGAHTLHIEVEDSGACISKVC